MKKSFRSHFWLLIALVLLGAWLQLWRLDFDSIWFDEAFSYHVASHASLSSVLEVMASDVHPPLYFLLLHGWMNLTGDSVFAMRALSALLIVLTLPAIYQLGRRLFNRRTGLLALVLAVLAPYYVVYGHEVRPYALALLLTTWLLLGLTLAFNGVRRGWWLYGIAALGALYSLYFAAVLVAAIFLWCLFSARHGSLSWRTVLLVHGLIGLGFVPQLLTFAFQTQTIFGSYWIPPPNPAAPLATMAFMLVATTLAPVAALLVMVLIPCWLALAAIDLRRPRAVFRRWLMGLFLLFLPMLAILVVSAIRAPIYIDRALSFLSPLLVVALAAGVAYARPVSPVRGLSIVTAVLMAVGTASQTLSSDLSKPAFKEASDWLAQAQDVPVLHLHDNSYLPLLYYLHARTGEMMLVEVGERSWLMPHMWRALGLERQDRATLAARLASWQGPLYIVAGDMEQQEADMLAALRARACAETVTPFGSLAVIELVLGPECATISR